MEANSGISEENGASFTNFFTGQSGEDNGVESNVEASGGDAVEDSQYVYDPFRAKKRHRNQKRKEQRARAAERAKILEGGGELPEPLVIKPQPTKSGNSSNDYNRGPRPYQNMWKRARLEQEQSPLYKNSITVMVVTNNSSHMIQEEDLAHIRSSLEDAMLSDDLGFVPCILYSSIYRGELKIVCADEVTRSWVEKLIPKVKPPTPDHPGYRYISFGSASIEKYLPKYRIWVPKVKDPSKVLQLIEKCNKGLEARKFHLRTVTNQENGRSCIVAVEIDMVKLMEQLDFQPFCGLGRIRFNPLASNKSMEEYEYANNVAGVSNESTSDSYDQEFDSGAGYEDQGFLEPTGPIGPMRPRQPFMGPRLRPPMGMRPRPPMGMRPRPPMGPRFGPMGPPGPYF